MIFIYEETQNLSERELQFLRGTLKVVFHIISIFRRSCQRELNLTTIYILSKTRVLDSITQPHIVLKRPIQIIIIKKILFGGTKLWRKSHISNLEVKGLSDYKLYKNHCNYFHISEFIFFEYYYFHLVDITFGS